MNHNTTIFNIASYHHNIENYLNAMNHNTTISRIASYHQPLQHYFNMTTSDVN